MTKINFIKSDRFKTNLENGNVEKVKENLEPAFVEDFIDPILEKKPIHLACENGNLEIVKLLMENNCDIESETKEGMKPIHLACESGHFEIVRLLIENKCNIESEDKWGWRLIHYVCERGQFDIVKLLIEKKCDIKSKEKLGLSPIHLACASGNLEIVKLLMENKCDIESKTKEGMKPVHLASLRGYFEIMKLLIQNKCDIENETDEGWRPIHNVCLDGNFEIVKLLILKNCQVNVSDKSGRTPLEIAKSKGHNKIVDLLSKLDKVTKQIKLSILENDDKNFATLYKSELLTGRGWLKMAYKEKADKIIKYFLNRPIDVTEVFYIKNIINNRPSELTNSELWEEVLLYKTIKDNHGTDFDSICRPHIINRPTKIISCSFLELAVKYGNFILVQEIMKKYFYNIEIWKRAKEIAFSKGYHHIHNSILNREALLKCRQNNNVSILHTAVSDNDPEMLEYILSKGLADPNYNHEVLGTALSFAILLCNRECLTVFDRF